MESEAREIPAASVVSTAREMATRWMWIALIPGVVAAVFALTLIAAHESPKHHPHPIAVVIVAGVVFVGLPGLLAIWYLLRARRYAQLARLAADDSSLTWHLTGKRIAVARAGVPLPEHTFTIAGYLRRSLTAVPRATLVK